MQRHDGDSTERHTRVPAPQHKARPASQVVDSMGLRARPGKSNRQVNRQTRINRGQQTMIIFT
ncbi:hypothetical protein DF156_11950 [Burkholderia ubonensis]|uniref:Uncharacterized protein n=1 Tax=Burkholderia ubonensis TaxID=101571 RepID=A0AB74D5P6_9BURK|nr:hypothetical protein DF155_09010 [Burkholderia ubonensis]RQP38739.1 hypothetical protein DF154_16785 [Burkholderia ubonensis]RQP42876.1 hypothetical protein DF156_11950 [Burkholderia ubonensis]RQP57188.1 hypothetical protein DF144_09125 [Burkholderia ubonensis]RQP62190.1 hypothetical protein DF159_14380 [Burkholderia ubonensis]